MSELFSQGEATPSRSPSNAYSLAGREIPVHEAQEIPIGAASAPVDQTPSWFYSQGGAHAGPVTFHDLQRMAARGEIGPDSLVWKSGMADWVASRNFPDLVFPGQGAVTSVSAVPPQTYPAPGVPAYSNMPPRTSGLAIASLVLGILVLWWNRKSPRNHFRGRLPGPDLSIEWQLDGQGNGSRGLGSRHHRTGIDSVPVL